ncbi:tetratricopeptide repeat protein [Saccharicrinis sp. GN24d3]|uniref:tetratricopeptide repeat protein n=1 Tax=Saccharicrinis sp. GN24d3 TaxID=3458416 RepID=UPI0040369F0F
MFDDKKKISDLFTGFPAQIKFAVDYIKNENTKLLLERVNELVDYNSEIIAKVIQKFEGNEEALSLLKLLSDYEYLSVNFLDKIYSGLPDKEKNLLHDFSCSLIIDHFGASGEYIKLNDGIRDYIRRSGIKLPEKLYSRLRKITEEGLQNYTDIEDDLSEFNITIQEAFVNEIEIPESFLIPSHFLLAMRELYDNRKNYEQVIELADRALNSYSHLDNKIEIEIKKWLCLALCRKRNPRLLKEVQEIKGPDHNFIIGFYYRLNKKYDKALERLLDLRDKYPNYYKAKRELVQVYVSTEDFEAAYSLAKENYENDKNNPYHIQSYLRCVYRKKEDIENADQIIQRLLQQLKESSHEKAAEMYYTSKAQFETFILEDRNIALGTVNEAIQFFPSNIYPLLIKLDISRKFFDVFSLASTLKTLEAKFKNHDLYYRLSFLCAKRLFFALNGQL